MSRLAVALAALVAASPVLAQDRGRGRDDPLSRDEGGAGEFRHRGWIGSRLASDKEGGCVMGLDTRRSAAFVAYASAKGAFKIGLGEASWTLEPGKEAIAAVTFDDSPPILLKGAAVSPTTVLFEAQNLPGEGGLEALVESARQVKLTYDGNYLRARLSGSSRALRLLRDCASAPAQARAAARDGTPAEGAPEAQERSAEFGFLRQGMAAGEANKRLLDAGWQAAGPAPGSGGADENPGFKRLRDRGVTAQSCSRAPTDCMVGYEDAYGNALRLTAAADDDAPTVKAWRLNPPDEPGAARGGAGDETPD